MRPRNERINIVSAEVPFEHSPETPLIHPTTLHYIQRGNCFLKRHIDGFPTVRGLQRTTRNLDIPTLPTHLTTSLKKHTQSALMLSTLHQIQHLLEVLQLVLRNMRTDAMLMTERQSLLQPLRRPIVAPRNRIRNIEISIALNCNGFCGMPVTISTPL